MARQLTDEVKRELGLETDDDLVKSFLETATAAADLHTKLGERIDKLEETERKTARRLDHFDVQLQSGGGVSGTLFEYEAVEQKGPFLGPEVKSVAPHFGGAEYGIDNEEKRLGAMILGLAHPEFMGQLSEAEVKSLQEGTGPGGSYFLTPQMAAMQLDRILPQTKVRQAGAIVLPMKAPDAYLAGFDSGFAPAWRGEGDAFSDATPTVRRIAMRAKSLAAKVVLTIEVNDDVENLSAQIEAELARGFAQGLDQAALTGAGGNEPMGILSYVASGDINATDLNGAPTDYGFLSAAVFRARTNDHYPNAALYSERTAGDLDVLQDSTNQPLRPSAAVAALSLLSSNNVPDVLSGSDLSGGAESAAIVGEWKRLIIGLRNEVRFQVDPYSGGDNGLITIRGYLRGDMAVTHFEAFEVANGITSS